MYKLFSSKLLAVILSAVLGLLFVNLINPTIQAQMPEHHALSSDSK